MKRYKEFINEEILGSGSRDIPPTKEKIEYHLRKLYKDSNYEKNGKLDERIKELLDLYDTWTDNDKQNYNDVEIALKLLQY
jgi:hypothetical protein